VLPAAEEATHALRAVRSAEGCLIAARPTWIERVRPVVDSLSADELFSVFGAFELSRVTLPHGWGMWGPTWYYFADEERFRGRVDKRVVRLTAEQVRAVDWRVFWHCTLGPEATYFGVYEGEGLAALVGVPTEDEVVWEISIDVAPEAKGRGLGSAVFGTAGRFILDHGRLILGATAPWNVPSARLMRSHGLVYVLEDVRSMKVPFRVPPQPLGSPLPGAEMRQSYPDWAMNRDILPKDG